LEGEAEPLERVPTLEDVRYLISLIDAMPAAPPVAGALEAELRSAVELVLSELRSLRVETESLQRGIALALRDLDLEALASEAMGVLDPLGQLQAWLADQLKALASWFAGVAEGAVRRLWDAFIRPALDSLAALAATARDRVMEVLGAVSRLAGQVGELLSRIGEVARAVAGVADAVRSAVAGAVSNLRDFVASSLASAVSSITQALGALSSGLKTAIDMLARIPEAVRSTVAGWGEALARAIASGVAAVSDAVSRAFGGLAATVSNLFERAIGAIAALGDLVSKGFASLSGQVLGALQGFAGAVSDLLGKVGASILAIADLAAKGFAGLLDALRSGFGDLWSKVRDAISAVAEAFARALAPIAESVSMGFEVLGRWMAQAGKALERVGVVIMGFVNAVLQLPERFSGFFKWIAEAVEGLRQALLGFFRDPVGAIRSALEKIGEWVWNALPDWLKSAIEGIKEALALLKDALVVGLSEFFKDPLGFIRRTLAWAAEYIWSLLPDWLKGAIESVKGFFVWLWERLRSFLENVAWHVYNAFKWLGENVWDRMPEPLKWIIENIQKALAAAWDAVARFFSQSLPGFFNWLWERVQELAKDPWGTIADGLKWIGEEVYKRLPDWLKSVIDTLKAVWERLKVELGKLIRDPLGTIWGWVTGFVSWLWERIVGFFQWLWERLQAFARWFFEVIIKAAQGLQAALSSTLLGAAESLLSGAAQVTGRLLALGERMGVGLLGVYDALFTRVAEGVVFAFARLFKKIGEKRGVGEIEFLKTILYVGSLYTLALDYAASAAKYASNLMKGMRWGYIDETRTKLGVGGAHGGAGVEKGFHPVIGIYTAPARIFGELGDYLFDLAASMRHQWFALVPRGLSLALEPAFMYVWKGFLNKFGLGDLPLSPPALPLVITAVQRLGFIEEFEKGKLGLFEKLVDYLLYRGYPMWFTRTVVGGGTEVGSLWIEVRDRFGKQLAIPMALIYEMPTPSELAEMMVRDAFYAYEDYLKWAARLGVHPNVAKFYYFLRFRYPDPRVLWNFAMRAASKMLWYVPTRGEAELAAKDAEVVGAYAPKAPVALNDAVATAFEMLTTFLKWQDYATFAWKEGWTSDAWLIADAMADIPSKLDARWLVRFGVTDWLAKRGVGVESKPWEMAGKVLDAAPASELTLDVKLLCKLLQATGLHPYYVPLSAVAEAMSAVTDERTLVRTGVTNLYERGLADYNTLLSLLEDMGTISFAVAYFDLASQTWRSGYVNVPLSFLPAERRLVAMRAEIDRHLEVYGKVLTEVARGVRELALDPGTAKEMLVGFARAVAERLSGSMKAILGRDVAFAPDEGYYSLWIKYAEMTAGIETTYRLRLLAQRVLGWVIYRVATGYVTEEELDQVISTLETHFNYTEKEAEAVRALARAVNRIAVHEGARAAKAKVEREEAIPTLGALASMAEYIEVPLDFVQRVLAERRVTGTYAELWLRYFAARPIASEVNALVGTYRRIVEYFGLPPTLEEQVKALMRAGGWTEREIQIFDLDLYLRRAYRVLSTFVPTLRQFVGDAMYLGEWEKLFEDLLRARGLEAEKYKAQAEYYKRLIKARKLWRRINSLIAELVNCYARGVIGEREMRQELQQFKAYGLDDDEIELIVKLAKYRYLRHQARS